MSEGRRKRGGLSRREFLAGAGGMIGLTGAALGSSSPARAEDRPNILWLVSEDNSPYIGAYGDPLARTPTIDGLAEEGVLYRNSFSTAPVCAPSRFSIITGMYATSCGPAHHMRASGNIPEGLRGFPAYLRDAGYYCTNNAKTDYNAPIDIADAWDESSNRAHWRNRPAGSPFFAVFNYGITHESQLFPGANDPLPDGTDPDDVQLPAYHPDHPQLRRDRALHYDQMSRLDDQLAERLAELEADGLADNTIVFYYSDHGGLLPRSKRFCYDSGLRTPLISHYPERFQHLAPAAAGSEIEDPVSLVDLGPTVLSLVGLPAPDIMHGRAFAGDRREEPRHHTFSFRNRMDETYDMTRTVRDGRFRYIRNYAPNLVYGQHITYMWQQLSVPTWEQLYCEGKLDDVQSAFWKQKPSEELYDLDSDPDEINNLADSPDHAAVLKRLSKALDDHILEVRDNGFIPEGSPLEGYDAASSDRDYPLARILKAANLASGRDPKFLPRFIAWLDDRNECMRYWAALGCVTLREEAAPAADALARRLDDTSGSVRVAAASALCWLGDAERGLAVLETALLEHENASVRLQAANALGSLGPRAKDAQGSIEQAADGDADRYVRDSAAHTASVMRGEYPRCDPASIAAGEPTVLAQ